MIKLFGSVEQLSELTFKQLCMLSEKCHIRSEKDIESDERSLLDFKKFLKSQTGIGSLIQLLTNEECDISWNHDSSIPTQSLLVDGKEFRDTELQVCLWKAVKYFVLNIK